MRNPESGRCRGGNPTQRSPRPLRRKGLNLWEMSPSSSRLPTYSEQSCSYVCRRITVRRSGFGRSPKRAPETQDGNPIQTPAGRDAPSALASIGTLGLLQTESEPSYEATRTSRCSNEAPGESVVPVDSSLTTHSGHLERKDRNRSATLESESPARLASNDSTPATKKTDDW